MDKDKGDKFVDFICRLPMCWFNAFRDAFIIIMFFEMGLIIFKLFDKPEIMILHGKIIVILISGFIYLFALALMVITFKKYLIPSIRKARERKEKKFFNELRKEFVTKK